LMNFEYLQYLSLPR